MYTCVIRQARKDDIEEVAKLIVIWASSGELVFRNRERVASIIHNFVVAEMWWIIIWCTSWEIKYQKCIKLVHSCDFPVSYEEVIYEPIWAEIRSHFVLKEYRKKWVWVGLIWAAVKKCIASWVPQEEIYLATGIPAYFISKGSFGYFNSRDKTILFYKWKQIVEDWEIIQPAIN